jgi:glycosyltransferase involved in cell wall biosynthesis
MSVAAMSSNLQSNGRTPDRVSVSAENISVAITVYNRRDYLIKAIESALDQTIPVPVKVFEDHSPDPGIRDMVEDRFADRIQYYQNTERRGLFGNWNVCLNSCATPWISILHDDDYLAPNFIEAMIALAQEAPDCGIYFSSIIHVDQFGKLLPVPSSDVPGSFRRLDPRSLAHGNDMLFPGQLFRCDLARTLGGFREASQFCGDWEMWFKLAYYFGAAQTSSPVAYNRSHEGVERGTNKIVRNGRKYALDFVQVKRNLALLRKTHPGEYLDRRKALSSFPIPTRLLLPYAARMPSRLLRYNWRLLLLSRPPHWRYAAFQAVVRLLGPAFLRPLSRVFAIFTPRR